MKPLLAFAYLGALLCLPANWSAAEDAPDTSLLAKEKQISRQRMMQIYDAIQEYRKDHKELPGYLSDLYPKYISDTNVFLCPTALRLRKTLPFPELLDPKILVHYGYEFSARPIQAMFGYSGPMTMAAWKRMQMMAKYGRTNSANATASRPSLPCGSWTGTATLSIQTPGPTWMAKSSGCSPRRAKPHSLISK